MLVLRDAVDTRKPLAMEAALDCLQRLVAYKLIQGPVHSINHHRDSIKREGRDAAAPLQFAAQPPQAQAVELMCRCDDTGDEAVELRLLKSLLTAATSPTLPLHGQALLLAVRACYNVFLTSRSEASQAAARATLTQMVTVVYQRLEMGILAVSVPPVAVVDALGISSNDTSTSSTFVQQFLTDVAIAIDPFGTVAEDVQSGLDDAFRVRSFDPHGPQIEDLYDTSDPLDTDHIDWRDKKDGNNIVNHELPPEQTKEDDKALNSKEDADIKIDEDSGYEFDNSSDMDSIADNKSSHPKATLHGALQKDAFLIFRALCKLSIRTADGSSAGEAAVLRGKALALELVKIVISNSGPVFRKGDRFMNAIKQYLCLALLKNCASPSQRVQALCASIFLTLLLKFRRELKAEIGVFYPMIFLRPIEPNYSSTFSGTSSGITASGSNLGTSGSASSVDPAQRGIVLRCLRDVCLDGQALVDIFVNYDCDLDGANLFERTVSAIVKNAQTGLGVSSDSLWGESGGILVTHRLESLRCLSAMMSSLLSWHKKTSQSAKGMSSNNIDRHDNHENDADLDDGTTIDKGIAHDVLVMDEALRSAFLDRLASSEGLSLPELARKAGRKEAEVVASWKSFKRVFEEGVELFNAKPAKGIAFLQNNHLVGESPSDVAQFLTSTRLLSKSQIGDYMGERDEYALKVMHAYVDGLDFEGLEFDVAIRRFLSGFRLPGEAQKIDRLMEKFAERYLLCNPSSFKSADVAYVLAYSVIMLNTDAHNPMVKNKMSKADFLRNNRGINDGGDLPEEWMESLYDRIVNNEIKMQGEYGEGMEVLTDQAAAVSQITSGSWLDTVMALVPGRQRTATTEPPDAAVRRAASFLREKAQGVRFYSAQDPEAVRPMMDASWAPILGALSVVFEYEDSMEAIIECLSGLASSIGIVSCLNMIMLRSTFLSVLSSFSSLHEPSEMDIKHALAFRELLKVAEVNGNLLGDDWNIILRCISRFELMKSLSGTGSDEATLFAETNEVSMQNLTKNKYSSRRNSSLIDISSSVADMQLQAMDPAKEDHKNLKDSHNFSTLPPTSVLMVVDPQDLNRLFVNSPKLNSNAIVEFVRTLCTVSREELRVGSGSPRVFSLGKIVETAHFNMDRIRLVWARIWAVLSEFFAEVGCHPSLPVAMFAVDSLRQLGIKFLERDELANYTFQNDFLRPFVMLVRRSKSPEIKELIIRCVSQMVLARYANIKSGWKSVFMVYTSAANDSNPHLVRLAFDTVEKIVRDHFFYITETEAITFTDCVNCLVAFTNNPHSIDVALNAIAFLRYCALQLAEGDVSMEIGASDLPADAEKALNINGHRIRPLFLHSSSEATAGDLNSVSSPDEFGLGRFTDRDEHMYFWFPLLVGLSELTFDPRPEIRTSALGVLFDILKFHGGSFTPRFWIRIFDSVLLPMFDQVRSECLDATTFTDDSLRSEVDAWLFETCTATLQHIVDVVVKYHQNVPGLLDRILTLLSGFIRRQHEKLAGIGVAALSQLILAAGENADEDTWKVLESSLINAMSDTVPQLRELMQRRMEIRASDDSSWSLGTGAGARRLAEVHTHAKVQLLLTQSCGVIFSKYGNTMPAETAVSFIGAMYNAADNALQINGDFGLRQSLRLAYAADGVSKDRALGEPPLMRLEIVAVQLCIETLKNLISSPRDDIRRAVDAESKLASICLLVLQRYEQQSAMAVASSEAKAKGFSASSPAGFGSQDRIAADPDASVELSVENASLAPIVVETLDSMIAINGDVFRQKLAREFFPVLTSLIGTPMAPPEVQRSLSDIFCRHFMPTGN